MGFEKGEGKMNARTIPAIQHEKVCFRLFKMPCCGQMLCWINPRLPNCCPECGSKIFSRMKEDGVTLIFDEDAWLKYHS